MALGISPASAVDSRFLSASRLVLGGCVGVAVMLVAFALRPNDEPSLLPFLACGVVLGLGRQGFDVLAMRVVSAAVAVVAGYVWVSAILHGKSCSSVACWQDVGFSLLVFAAPLAAAFAVIALATNLVWCRGVGSLSEPQIRWAAVSRAQWAMIGGLALSAVVLLVALVVSLGIGPPP